MAGIPVLVMGRSGTGKSCSLRNFKKDELSIINVNGKKLPFKNDFQKIYVSDNPQKIIMALKKAPTPVIVIDDSQYIMANAFMRNALVKGFDKYNLIGKDFWDIIYAIRELSDDKIVYFLHHEETDDSGITHAKTQGKLIDNHVTLEGMFTIVLRTFVQDGFYGFSTQNSGTDTVKSPMGMFADVKIENDLYLVDSTIREYYNMPAIRKAEEKAAAK